MRKRKNKSPSNRKPELIIKSNTECSSRFDGWLAPSVYVLGNKEGLQWLANFFAEAAGSVNELGKYVVGDPDNHVHLDCESPVNRRLSDDFGLMVGSFSHANRRRVLRDCGVSKAKRVSGNPVRHLLAHWEHIESSCRTINEAAVDIREDLKALKTRLEALLSRLEGEQPEPSEPT